MPDAAKPLTPADVALMRDWCIDARGRQEVGRIAATVAELEVQRLAVELINFRVGGEVAREAVALARYLLEDGPPPRSRP